MSIPSSNFPGRELRMAAEDDHFDSVLMKSAREHRPEKSRTARDDHLFRVHGHTASGGVIRWLAAAVARRRMLEKMRMLMKCITPRIRRTSPIFVLRYSITCAASSGLIPERRARERKPMLIR